MSPRHRLVAETSAQERSGSWQWLLRVVGALCLMPLISTCDGGLFGTGDGSDIVTPPPGQASDPPGGFPSDETATDASMAPESGPEIGSGGIEGNETNETGDNSEPLADTESIAFENLLIGTRQQRPLLSLYNLGTQPLNARLDEGSALLFDSPVNPDTLSEFVTLPFGLHELPFIHADSKRVLARLAPLNLGAGSATRVLIRNRLDSVGEVNAEQFELLPLPTKRVAADDTLARVRLIQVYPLSHVRQAAELLLLPAGMSPGATELSLGLISATTFSLPPAYQEIVAGDYVLQDSLSRFASIPLTLEPGQWYTLLLVAERQPLLMLRDSQE